MVSTIGKHNNEQYQQFLKKALNKDAEIRFKMD